MKFNSERLETVIAGFLFVSIGTMIAASRVGAESNHPMSSQTKSSTPATGVATNTATPAATVAPAACAPIETPDAMCTVPLKKGPETKICFGDHHPRCFEMKTGHLVQTVNGGVIRETSLTSEQQANVKAAVMTYSEWLEKDLAKKPNKFNACQNTVSIDSMSEHKVFCISRLAKKEADAKSKDLFTVLDSPTSAVVRSSPTSKRSSAL